MQWRGSMHGDPSSPFPLHGGDCDITAMNVALLSSAGAAFTYGHYTRHRADATRRRSSVICDAALGAAALVWAAERTKVHAACLSCAAGVS